MISDKPVPPKVEEAMRYAESVEPFAENGAGGVSRNEERIIVLAHEVKRLRKLLQHAKR